MNYSLSYVQDSRLLGEIHVSLLRSIIKDIEDAARTPSMGLGANQNCAANPGGGHPQIVEGVRGSAVLVVLHLNLVCAKFCSAFKCIFSCHIVLGIRLGI